MRYTSHEPMLSGTAVMSFEDILHELRRRKTLMAFTICLGSCSRGRVLVPRTSRVQVDGPDPRAQ